MDKSPLRRGVATIWKKWGADTAVLSGDVMCIDSYRRIAQRLVRCSGRSCLFSATAARCAKASNTTWNSSPARKSDRRICRMIGLKTGR